MPNLVNGKQEISSSYTVLDIPESAREELRQYNKKLAYFPRFHFASAFQVALLRSLFRGLALLPSLLRKLDLTAREEEVSFAGRKVRVRIIEPKTPPKGIVVDLYGGGWCIMQPIHDDPLTGPIAEAGFVVVSADYRHAPETALTDIINDAETALAWALTEGTRHYGVSSVLLHGDSAGAHLCICAALRCRPLPHYARLKGQALFFGAYDLGGTPSAKGATAANTLILHGPTLVRVFARVAREDDERLRRRPEISPLFADLRGLPPSLLFVGSADPLIDDGRLLVEELRSSASEVELIEIEDAPYAFNRFPLKIAAACNAYCRNWLIARAAD